MCATQTSAFVCIILIVCCFLLFRVASKKLAHFSQNYHAQRISQPIRSRTLPLLPEPTWRQVQKSAPLSLPDLPFAGHDVGGRQRRHSSAAHEAAPDQQVVCCIPQLLIFLLLILIFGSFTVEACNETRQLRAACKSQTTSSGQVDPFGCSADQSELVEASVWSSAKVVVAAKVLHQPNPKRRQRNSGRSQVELADQQVAEKQWRSSG